MFFFFTGGRIDHGHHDGQAVRALHDTVAMNKAVSKATDMINLGKKKKKKIKKTLLLYLAYGGCTAVLAASEPSGPAQTTP